VADSSDGLIKDQLDEINEQQPQQQQPAERAVPGCAMFPCYSPVLVAVLNVDRHSESAAKRAN